MIKNISFWSDTLQFLAHGRKYCLVVFGFLLLLINDTVFIFAGSCLHLLFEFIASIIEHWLHVTFDLTEREAQIAFFYLFFTLTGIVVWQLSKKIYQNLQDRCKSANGQIKRMVATVNWQRIAFCVSIFGASMLLLS